MSYSAIYMSFSAIVRAVLLETDFSFGSYYILISKACRSNVLPKLTTGPTTALRNSPCLTRKYLAQPDRFNPGKYCRRRDQPADGVSRLDTVHHRPPPIVTRATHIREPEVSWENVKSFVEAARGSKYSNSE